MTVSIVTVAITICMSIIYKTYEWIDGQINGCLVEDNVAVVNMIPQTMKTDQFIIKWHSLKPQRKEQTEHM